MSTEARPHPQIVAFVPIKRVSERLPHKNYLPLGGAPLYSHIFRTLINSPSVATVYLFTSEPREDFDVPSQVQYLQKDKHNNRPIDIIKEFCRRVISDYYVLAHATTPFTRADTIKRAIGEVLTGKYDSAVTVERVSTFAWCANHPVNYDPNDVPKTQEIPPVLVETSGFYLFSRGLALIDSRRIGYRPYFCEVSFPETIDIDYLWQFKLATLCFQSGIYFEDSSATTNGEQGGGHLR